MKKLLINVLQWYFITRTKWRANRLHFVAAVKKAEKLAQGEKNRKGKRNYVYFLGGKYRVVNRKQVQWLKQERVIKSNMSLEKMKGIQLYDTMGHENSHPIYTNLEIKGINIIYQKK
jgi:trehalose utilization protein